MFIFEFFLYPLFSFSQCGIVNTAFSPKEKVTYSAYYNWGFIWIDAGMVTFETDTTQINGKKAWHLKSVGVSRKSYDWIYTVRDTFESYTEYSDLKPLKFRRHTLEGNYEVLNEFMFDYKEQKIYTDVCNTKKGRRRDTLSFFPCTIDVLSGSYYFRNLDFENMNNNKKIKIPVIIDNEIHNLHIKYLGIENVETKNGEIYNCIKISVMLVAGTIFKGGEDMLVWVSNDENKIPVLVEAKILIGSVKAMLNTSEGVRHEQRAKIK